MGKALCSVGSYDYARKLGGTTTVWRYYERMDIDPGTPLKDAEAKEVNNQAIAANDAYDKNDNDLMEWGPTGASGVTKLDNSSSTFMKTAESLIDGRKNTGILGATATYTAAQACLNFESWRYIDFYQRGNLLSEFFLPSVGQYILMLKGLGVYEQSSNGAVVIEAINNLFQQSHSQSTLPTDGTPI